MIRRHRVVLLCLLPVVLIWLYLGVVVVHKLGRAGSFAVGNTNTGAKSILVLVLTTPSLDNREKRVLLRELWAGGLESANLKFTFQLRFVACYHSSLTNEPDVVLLQCQEGYAELSSKVLKMFAWALASLDAGKMHFDYVIKTDCDVFVNLEALSNELSALRLGRGGFWWGFVHKEMLANRDATDKNSDLDYPLPGYPHYTTGVLYALDVFALRLLLAAFASGRLMLLRNEDQTIGVALSRIGLHPVHTNKLQQWTVCSSDLITIHPCSKRDFAALAANMRLETPRPLCKLFPQRTTCPLCYPKSVCNSQFSGYKWWSEWKCEHDGATIMIDKLGTIAWSRHWDQLGGRLSSKQLAELSQTDHAKVFINSCTYEICNLDTLMSLNNATVECDYSNIQERTGERRFFLVWTTGFKTFSLKHHRVIESIFYHHPKATVRVMSNTLPCSMFWWLRRDGFNIKVTKFDVFELARELPGRKWLENLEQWKKGPYFYAHYADLVRLLVLYRFGGVYLDTDIIFVNRIPQNVRNAVGVEHCDQLDHDFCMFLPEFGSSWAREDRKNLFYTPNSIMVFEAGHEAVLLSLEEFDKAYDPLFWPCGTVYLSRAVRVLREQERLKPTEILEKQAFFPVSWQEHVRFQDALDVRLWRDVQVRSIAVHLWNKWTGSMIPREDRSLLFRLFESFSLYNKKKN